jgi:dual specificity phosphatase 12
MSNIRYYLPDIISDNIMYYLGHCRCYLQGYVNTTFSASEITDKIFIGDLASASNFEALKEQGITHILTIMNGAYEIFPDKFTYKMIHVNDDPWVDIGKFFDESNEFIEQALLKPGSKIMIHCQRGVSRSVTLLLAYKLKKMNDEEKISVQFVEQAIKNILTDVKAHREIADPNQGFLESLKAFVHRLNGYEYKNLSEKKEINTVSNTSDSRYLDFSGYSDCSIPHQEPGTRNQEPGTRNQEPGTRNQEPGTRNQEPKT